MAVVDSLTAWGIQRAVEVVGVAAEAGLPVHIAAALLEQESGGANTWGHDRVPNPGVYVSGAEVTEAAYRAYRHALSMRTAGQQGVGPAQLTSVGYQDQADALGGCWVPSNNLQIGFRLLAGYIRQWGLADAFRAYNGGGGNRHPGSNPDADIYSAQAMAKTAKWATRLGTSGVEVLPSVAPSPVPRAALEDDLMASISINPDAAGRFHEAIGAEAASVVASKGFVSFGSTYGGTSWTVAALGADGAVLAYWPDVRTTNNTQTARELPPGTRHVTTEGVRDNDGTRPWASIWGLR